MILAVVKGNVVSTNKTEKLLGSKLLIVEEWNIDTRKSSGQPRVALDLVGAGEGELVMCVNGSSARQTEQTDKRPVDMAIVGIVDQVEMNGAVCYKKYGEKAAGKTEPQAIEPVKAPEPKPEPVKTPEPKPEPKPEPVKAPVQRTEKPGNAGPETVPARQAAPVRSITIDDADRVPNPYRGRKVDSTPAEQFHRIVTGEANRSGK